MEVDLRNPRSWLLLAGAMLVVAFAGSVAIVKIGVSFEAGWMSDLVKGPKLQKVELGSCTQLFDRDTGQVVKESCRTSEEDAKVKTLAENLRKLTAELSQTKTDLKHSKSAELGLRDQVKILNKGLQDAQRESNKVPQLQAEVARWRDAVAKWQQQSAKQKAVAEEAASNLRKQIEENAKLRIEADSKARKEIGGKVVAREDGLYQAFVPKSQARQVYDCLVSLGMNKGAITFPDDKDRFPTTDADECFVYAFDGLVVCGPALRQQLATCVSR